MKPNFVIQLVNHHYWLVKALTHQIPSESNFTLKSCWGSGFPEMKAMLFGKAAVFSPFYGSVVDETHGLKHGFTGGFWAMVQGWERIIQKRLKWYLELRYFWTWFWWCWRDQYMTSSHFKAMTIQCDQSRASDGFHPLSHDHSLDWATDDGG